MSSPVGVIPCPWPMSPWESSEDSVAAHTAEEPKGVGQLNSGEASQSIENATRATQDMADGVAGTAGERWEQTMQASSDAAHAALEKAVEARDGASNLLQQAGSALGNAAQSLKDAVTPPQ